MFVGFEGYLKLYLFNMATNINFNDSIQHLEFDMLLQRERERERVY